MKKISRRVFIAGAGAAVAMTGLSRFYRPTPPVSVPGGEKPNILVLIADDMRFDATGYLGNSIIKTPHLDRLAESSFIFDNHFVTTSVCWSSRASILSGTYLHRHGVHSSSRSLPARLFADSYPQVLRENGYYTGFIGKWGIGGQPKRAFDYWRGYAGQGEYYSLEGNPERHLTDIQTDQALEFLTQAPRAKPFLLTVCYKAPHGPVEHQTRFAKLYENAAILRPVTDTQEAFENSLPRLLQNSRGRHDYLREHFGSESGYQEYVRDYYRLISGMDDSIGTLVDWLKKNSLFENTLILFSSDNGFMLGEHGLAGKWCMYEESIRTPLLVRLPESKFPDPRAVHISDLSLNVDISPTLIAAANIPIPSRVQGKSLLSLMQGDRGPWREGFYYEHPPIPSGAIKGVAGYRSKEWKYARYYARKKTEECLFHLDKDPRELTNLAGNPAHRDTLHLLRSMTKKAKKHPI